MGMSRFGCASWDGNACDETSSGGSGCIGAPDAWSCNMQTQMASSTGWHDMITMIVEEWPGDGGKKLYGGSPSDGTGDDTMSGGALDDFMAADGVDGQGVSFVCARLK